MRFRELVNKTDFSKFYFIICVKHIYKKLLLKKSTFP